MKKWILSDTLCYNCEIYMIDSDRRPFLKSASTDVIYLKSQSDLTASFPNSQICGRFIDIKSTYLSERKSVVTWLMLVKFVHHLHCILYQMNAKPQSSRHKSISPKFKEVDQWMHASSFLCRLPCSILCVIFNIYASLQIFAVILIFLF